MKKGALAIGAAVLLVCVALLLMHNAQERTADETPTVTTKPYSPEQKKSPDTDSSQIEDIISKMTLEEKVYQMMFVTPEALTGVGQVVQAGETTKAALEAKPVGGIIYFSPNITSREQITAMITACQSYSKIPLFIGVDEEGGRVARIANKGNMGTTKLAAMKNVQSREEAYQVGLTLGSDLKGLLFNVDFAPVADVIVEEKNSEIGDRSFGTDPLWVGDCVAGVVKGLEEKGVASVLKHFPGHGSTTVDSHTGYSASYRSIDELRACEFVPFKKGIEAGSDFVMVSHMTLVNVIEDKLPASLSGEVITGYLKGELGFRGIVITDSLSMGAITTQYTQSEAAVMAVEAGCDMLLMPRDITAAANAIIKAVNDGKIPNERIDQSVRKILEIKKEKGLI